MVNDSQQRTAAIDGLSYIARLIYRFTEVGRLYFKDKGCTDTTALASEIIKLCRSVLEFQARAICQFDRKRAHQFARNLVEADGWEKRLEQIRSCEAECEKIRVLLHSKEQQQGMERLESLIETFNAENQSRGDGVIAKIEASREEGKESECLATLRTTDYESDKSRIANHIPGTCTWFLSHDKYHSWLSETRSRLLWVTADPGCGKSVLSKFLVNSYIKSATTSATTVCYFFFRDGSENNQDGTNALSALLHQLFKQKRALLRHALSEFEHNKTKLSGLFETLWSIFLKATTDSEAGKIICVLDALDECSQDTREPLLEYIGEFFSDAPASSTVKFIITSRPSTLIELALWKTYRNVSSVKLTGESDREMSTIQKEISLVINNKVEQFRQSRQHKVPNDDAHLEISKQLAQVENRTYLWVSLIFPELERNVWSGRGKLLHVIKTIPSTVREAYERILSYSNDTEKARRLLHLVLADQRPLTLREMNTALAITDDCTSAEKLELDPEPVFQDTVRELCGLFISVNDCKVYLIHQTAREFLLASTMTIPDAKKNWEHSMHLSTSHFELAKTCLLYLHLSGLQPDPAVRRDDIVLKALPRKLTHRHVSDQAFHKHALQSYSSTHWYYHVSNIETEVVDSLVILMLSLTTRGSPGFENWSTQLSEHYAVGVGSRRLTTQDVVEMDQLSLAVNLTLRPLAKHLLKREMQTQEERIILNRAAAYAIRSCPDIFHLFLNKGLDLETQMDHGNSFLHKAARYKRTEVAQLLIEAGATVNMKNKDLREPLYCAVQSGSKKMVYLLLKRGAHVNDRDKNGQTVLFAVISFARRRKEPEKILAMAAYLLENGAQYEVKDNCGQTPLSWAATKGNFPIAELLVKYGAEIDSRDCTGRTALSYANPNFAASTENGNLVSLLIESGAQVDSKDRNGRTLSYAAECWYHDDKAVVAGLIQQGAQIDTACNDMRTPLSYAANCCLQSRLKCLIENGGTINSSDWKGNTPLLYAAQGHRYPSTTVACPRFARQSDCYLERAQTPMFSI